MRDTKFVYFQICLREASERPLKACDSAEIREAFEEVDRRELVYDYKCCNGCGICVDICPTDALELGPLTEIIAGGLDAPPVIMDVNKCPFCGMCAAFCPYNAFEMFISLRSADEGADVSSVSSVSNASVVGGIDSRDDDAREPVRRSESGCEEWTNFIEIDAYPHLNPSISIDEERCLPCMLCERVCPMDALEVEWSLPKKEEIAPFDDARRGEIEIDMDKCSLCGVCTKFCDALMIVEREFSVEEPVPFADLLIDEDACDYCGICEILCPEDAIRVNLCGADKVHLTEDLIARLRSVGRLKLDEKKCKKCGWCVFVCPYDAISVEKPFDGEILLQNLDKCDPSGCSVCRDVCPFNAWFVVWDEGRAGDDDRHGSGQHGRHDAHANKNAHGSRRGHVEVETSVCIFCGACEKACPEDVIVVVRKNARTTPLPKTPPWRKQWSEAISKLLSPTTEAD